MAQVFKTREAAEKVAASVKEKLTEHKMHLAVTVIRVGGGYAVAVVSYY